MQRLYQILLLFTFLPWCWFGMQAVHELGHVLGVWISGGGVQAVVLYPLDFSRTVFSLNPQPLVAAWGGPLVGVLLPLLAWGVAAPLKLPAAFLLRFFAGFCLIVNGAYIGLGSFERLADAGDLIEFGSPVWTLWLFGAICIPAGLLLWHGLGAHFGLGKQAKKIPAWIAYGSGGLLVATLALEFTLSPR